jgi:ABC-type multidrug transport system fused ATPase/permease subunit
VDISTLGLQDLRSRLSIVPQDPMLFCGTLRTNLDPTGSYTDEEVVSALKVVGIWDKVSRMDGGLEIIVDEAGDNFSLGEKQLFCLARALVCVLNFGFSVSSIRSHLFLPFLSLQLKKSAIVVMDEASASLDLETDQKIRSVVETEFKQSTVLTIAHRLHTIVGSDRIMVLDQGKLVEFDSPTVLANKPNGFFAQLLRDAMTNEEQDGQKQKGDEAIDQQRMHRENSFYG